ASEEIVLKGGAEGIRSIANQPAGRGRAEVAQDRHQVGRGPLVGGVLEDVVFLAVEPAVDGVNQSVPVAAAGALEERGGEDPFAAGEKLDVDRVVHAAGH